MICIVWMIFTLKRVECAPVQSLTGLTSFQPSFKNAKSSLKPLKHIKTSASIHPHHPLPVPSIPHSIQIPKKSSSSSSSSLKFEKLQINDAPSPKYVSGEGVLTPKRFIGEGAYGAVYEYEYEGHQVVLILCDFNQSLKSFLDRVTLLVRHGLVLNFDVEKRAILAVPAMPGQLLFELVNSTGDSFDFPEYLWDFEGFLEGSGSA